MKNFKKTLTSILLLLTLCLGLGQPFAGAKTPARALAESTQKDSLFLIDVSLVKVNGDKIYVFDEDDQTIKVISGKTHKFEAENDRIAANGVKDMLFLDDDLIIYSLGQDEPKQASLSAVSLNAETFGQPVSITGTESLTTLSSAKSLEIVKCQEQSYILLYPADPVSGQFELAKISKEENITISDAKTFSISSGVGAGALVQSYEHAKAFCNEEKIIIVFSKQTTLLACELDPTSTTTINSVSEVTVNETTIEENILNFDLVRFKNAEADELAIVSESKIVFFTFDMAAKTLTPAEREDITFDEEFSLTDSSLKGGYISCIDNAAQKLVIYDLGEEVFNPSGYLLENDHVHEVLYDDAREYVYKKVAKDTPVKQTPYSSSRSPLATAKVDHYVTILGQGYNQDDTLVEGWSYVLYTENGQNYYGYVSTLDTKTITDEEVGEFTKNYVTVLAYTKIYSLPSNVIDEKNVEVREIATSSSARLHVLSTLRDYTTFGANETSSKYLLVTVNGTDLGFIDRSRVIEVGSVTERVLPNATVMRNNCKIFVTANDKGEALDVILNKGHRVKVIGKRDTITNYTLITFNDEDGNELTGYIYTYNLEADSWNTVQFIGMFLVLINVILLIVIICVKNKVTR